MKQLTDEEFGAEYSRRLQDALAHFTGADNDRDTQRSMTAKMDELMKRDFANMGYYLEDDGTLSAIIKVTFPNLPAPRQEPQP